MSRRTTRVDLDAVLVGAYRRRYGFARVVIALFVLMDVRFKGPIFPSYLEVVGARTSETSGRGIGMSALKSAVVSLGGDLEVDSEPGSGTRLLLRFPASALASRWRPPPAA